MIDEATHKEYQDQPDMLESNIEVHAQESRKSEKEDILNLVGSKEVFYRDPTGKVYPNLPSAEVIIFLNMNPRYLLPVPERVLLMEPNPLDMIWEMTDEFRKDLLILNNLSKDFFLRTYYTWAQLLRPNSVELFARKERLEKIQEFLRQYKVVEPEEDIKATSSQSLRDIFEREMTFDKLRQGYSRFYWGDMAPEEDFETFYGGLDEDDRKKYEAYMKDFFIEEELGQYFFERGFIDENERTLFGIGSPPPNMVDYSKLNKPTHPLAAPVVDAMYALGLPKITNENEYVDNLGKDFSDRDANYPLINLQRPESFYRAREVLREKGFESRLLDLSSSHDPYYFLAEIINAIQEGGVVIADTYDHFGGSDSPFLINSLAFDDGGRIPIGKEINAYHFGINRNPVFNCLPEPFCRRYDRAGGLNYSQIALLSLLDGIKADITQGAKYMRFLIVKPKEKDEQPTPLEKGGRYPAMIASRLFEDPEDTYIMGIDPIVDAGGRQLLKVQIESNSGTFQLKNWLYHDEISFNSGATLIIDRDTFELVSISNPSGLTELHVGVAVVSRVETVHFHYMQTPPIAAISLIEGKSMQIMIGDQPYMASFIFPFEYSLDAALAPLKRGELLRINPNDWEIEEVTLTDEDISRYVNIYHLSLAGACLDLRSARERYSSTHAPGIHFFDSQLSYDTDSFSRNTITIMGVELTMFTDLIFDNGNISLVRYDYPAGLSKDTNIFGVIVENYYYIAPGEADECFYVYNTDLKLRLPHNGGRYKTSDGVKIYKNGNVEFLGKYELADEEVFKYKEDDEAHAVIVPTPEAIVKAASYCCSSPGRAVRSEQLISLVRWDREFGGNIYQGLTFANWTDLYLPIVQYFNARKATEEYPFAGLPSVFSPGLTSNYYRWDEIDFLMIVYILHMLRDDRWLYRVPQVLLTMPEKLLAQYRDLVEAVTSGLAKSINERNIDSKEQASNSTGYELGRFETMVESRLPDYPVNNPRFDSISISTVRGYHSDHFQLIDNKLVWTGERVENLEDKKEEKKDVEIPNPLAQIEALVENLAGVTTEMTDAAVEIERTGGRSDTDVFGETLAILDQFSKLGLANQSLVRSVLSVNVVYAYIEQLKDANAGNKDNVLQGIRDKINEIAEMDLSNREALRRYLDPTVLRRLLELTSGTMKRSDLIELVLFSLVAGISMGEVMTVMNFEEMVKQKMSGVHEPEFLKTYEMPYVKARRKIEAFGEPSQSNYEVYRTLLITELQNLVQFLNWYHQYDPDSDDLLVMSELLEGGEDRSAMWRSACGEYMIFLKGLAAHMLQGCEVYTAELDFYANEPLEEWMTIEVEKTNRSHGVVVVKLPKVEGIEQEWFILDGMANLNYYSQFQLSSFNPVNILVVPDSAWEHDTNAKDVLSNTAIASLDPNRVLAAYRQSGSSFVISPNSNHRYHIFFDKQQSVGVDPETLLFLLKDLPGFNEYFAVLIPDNPGAILMNILSDDFEGDKKVLMEKLFRINPRIIARQNESYLKENLIFANSLLLEKAVEFKMYAHAVFIARVMLAKVKVSQFINDEMRRKCEEVIAMCYRELAHSTEDLKANYSDLLIKADKEKILAYRELQQVNILDEDDSTFDEHFIALISQDNYAVLEDTSFDPLKNFKERNLKLLYFAIEHKFRIAAMYLCRVLLQSKCLNETEQEVLRDLNELLSSLVLSLPRDNSMTEINTFSYLLSDDEHQRINLDSLSENGEQRARLNREISQVVAILKDKDISVPIEPEKPTLKESVTELSNAAVIASAQAINVFEQQETPSPAKLATRRIRKEVHQSGGAYKKRAQLSVQSGDPTRLQLTDKASSEAIQMLRGALGDVSAGALIFFYYQRSNPKLLDRVRDNCTMANLVLPDSMESIPIAKMSFPDFPKLAAGD